MTERVVGDYIICGPLGKGGFASVKLGKHKTTGQYIAIKKLKSKAMNEGERRQVEREIVSMNKVQHENVLKLLGVEWEVAYPKKSGKTEDASLLYIELAPGGEMLDFLSHTGLFEEDIARTYFHQLHTGLSCCHSVGIAHRDLKPENLLLDAKFRLKIADFGLAASVREGRMNRTQAGTKQYMAPEVIQGKRYDAFKADVYSMGVVLFITLAGFPPYAKPDMSDWWFNKLSNGRLDLFWKAHCRTVYFSEDAKDLINKMLAPDPAKRISMDAIAQHPWIKKGTLISPEVLFNEFQRRKQVVDRVKEREAQQKKAQQGEITEGDGVVVRDGGDVVVDPELDDLPPIAPDMHGFLAKEGAADEDDEEEEEEDDDDEEAEAPAVPDMALANVTYSQFTTKLSPRDLLYQLNKIITPMARSVNVQKKKFKLKAMVLAGGSTEFEVRVYQTENGSLAAFKKTDGNRMPFQALYSRISHHEKLTPFITEQ